MSTFDDRATQVGHTAREVAGHARDASVELAQTARDDASQVLQVARDQGVDVARTAREQATGVVREAAGQAHRVTDDVKARVRDEATRQHQSLVDRAAAFAEELHTMAGQQPQTPARELVGLLAGRSTVFADYLGQHGPEAVLSELESFARRRPGTFVLAAVAAGFVAGRLAKGMLENRREGSPT